MYTMTIKYIFYCLHIYYPEEPHIPQIKYKGKNLILTGHIRHELYDIYKKNLDLIFDILGTGRTRKRSKVKREVLMDTKQGTWELVYVETEDDIVLIHLKLR